LLLYVIDASVESPVPSTGRKRTQQTNYIVVLTKFSILKKSSHCVCVCVCVCQVLAMPHRYFYIAC